MGCNCILYKGKVKTVLKMQRFSCKEWSICCLVNIKISN